MENLGGFSELKTLEINQEDGRTKIVWQVVDRLPYLLGLFLGLQLLGGGKGYGKQSDPAMFQSAPPARRAPSPTGQPDGVFLSEVRRLLGG